ncbi:MAG: hypothetical protein H0W68_09495 [Gemmatimonadaceae bacterium]|nr:hypothetical protein [Gemmatimonadaceae bacterium]
MRSHSLDWRRARHLLLAVFAAACGTPSRQLAQPLSPAGRALQLVVVTTPSWNATSGTVRRFERNADSNNWREAGRAEPVVVGRTGLAWGSDAPGAAPSAPRKREGDGKAPAGLFPLDTTFGFAPRAEMVWARLPYAPLQPGSECVDDGKSTHYNTVVDRATVDRVDWTSAERMREISVYRMGVIVGYNAPPRAGRGSCIFLHIWSGPTSSTAGCTAMDATVLESLIRWLDPRARPVIVQLTESEYARLRGHWGLPRLAG